jgi:hypothetical protein
MSVPVHHASTAVSRTLAQNAPLPKHRVADYQFKNQISSAMQASSSSPAHSPASHQHTPPEAAASANSMPDWRQIFGGGQQDQPKTESAVSDSKSDPITEQTATAPQTPVDALAAALVSLGIDPQSLKMVAHNDPVAFPGGGWINHLITVTTATGKEETFMADLVGKTPQVAAVEVQELIRMG